MTIEAPQNPYLQQVKAALPRVLSLIDTNPISVTYGVADRFFWAWKGIDFANGTFQGLANGLSRLLAADLLKGTIDEHHILAQINLLIDGVRRVTRRNGSLDEIMPHESSFCVTALVAHDCLVTLDLIGHRLKPERRSHHVDTIEPLIAYIQQSGESHGFISNHLAVAIAALARWAKLQGRPFPDRARTLLERLLSQQSSEGWFREYSGADPGYETLCLTYLADVHLNNPELELDEPIRRSVAFLRYFAHPDGSFGGLYGSRSTRVYYPGGVEALAARLPEAAALSACMARSISCNRTVTLNAVDAPNLTPVFNSYCLAASRYVPREPSVLPSLSSTPFRQRFPEAGLLVDRGLHTYSIVSWKKGGVCYHFRDNKLVLLDAGALARDRHGRLHTAQASGDGTLVQDTCDRLVIEAPVRRYRVRTPTPFDFFVLRLFCLTFMRIGAINRWFKRWLVDRLILNHGRTRTINRRTVTLGEKLEIQDDFLGHPKLDRVTPPVTFYATHMASQGYWQPSDIRNKWVEPGA